MKGKQMTPGNRHLAWTPLPVPWAVEAPDRIPKQRYYSPEFYALETEQFWPRVWQMACRLEEIPKPGDFVEYEILDQSIIVVRLDGTSVRAYHNACRHRGMKLVEGRGSRRSFVCPFHGWCWGLDGSSTFVARSELFAEDNLCPEDLRLASVRCELWGGCAWINLDDGAAPLRECIEPFASINDAWKVESLRTEWWKSCRLPVNWKLATEAFMEGYHVPQTHPQLLPHPQPAPPSQRPDSAPTQDVIATSLYFMRTLGEGMGGMVHENDIRIAEGLQNMELPADPAAAMATWRSTLNDAIVAWHRARGCDVPELNELDRRGVTDAIGFCFPHYFVLPTYSSASSYRIRPLGPEETLFEVWSLTRIPPDRATAKLEPPEPMAPDDPSWPTIPAQDFSNLPRQQKGLHARGFEYMRLSDRIEGLISNFERVVDGFLAGLPHDRLVPAIQRTNTTIDVPVADLELGESVMSSVVSKA
jgi:Rieske 2Fe-2S family protein